MSVGHRLVLAFVNVHDNDTAAYTPQFWAREGLEILTETMIAANLVHRDFENTLAQYGDVVNVHKPGEFKAKRKTDCEDVTVQDVTSDKIQVTLNQHVHTSFLICDGQESMAMQDLIDEFAKPAVIAQARFVDQMVLGQYAQFLNNTVGSLGSGSPNAKNDLLEARERLNKQKVPMDNRLGILNPDTETEMLKTDLFIQAQQVGDQGQALRNGSLGTKFGLSLWMSQNMPVVLDQGSYVGAVNNVGGYPAGTQIINIDQFVDVTGTGSFITIGGTPYRVKAHSETAGGTTSIQINPPGLTAAVPDDAPVKYIEFGNVNFPGGYPAGYIKEITVFDFSDPPQIGQAIAFGTDPASPVYAVMESTTSSILLDRPLEEPVTNNEQVNLGPAGSYNFFFTRDAIALVVRPLAKPKPGTGALSSVVNANGLSMRATITYDGRKQGHLVTLDFLCGIKVLRPELGVVLLG